MSFEVKKYTSNAMDAKQNAEYKELFEAATDEQLRTRRQRTNAIWSRARGSLLLCEQMKEYETFVTSDRKGKGKASTD